MMKTTALGFLLIILAFSGSAGAQCKGGMVVIVNQSNPTQSLSVAQIRRLVLGDVRAWPNNKPVTLVIREANSAITNCVLSGIVRLSNNEYIRYLLNAEFRGEDPITPQTVTSNATAAKFVAATPGAISFVDADFVQSAGTSVKVIRVNGKLPGEAGYKF